MLGSTIGCVADLRVPDFGGQEVLGIAQALTGHPAADARAVPIVNHVLSSSFSNAGHAWGSASFLLPLSPEGRTPEREPDQGFHRGRNPHFVAFPPGDAVGGDAEPGGQRRPGSAWRGFGVDGGLIRPRLRLYTVDRRVSTGVVGPVARKARTSERRTRMYFPIVTAGSVP